MKKEKITVGSKNYTIHHDSFKNEDYKKEWIEFVPGWKDHDGNPIRYDVGTFSSDDGNDFAVYDGAQNYLGRVNKSTGEIEYNGEKDDYKESFIIAAKKVICE